MTEPQWYYRRNGIECGPVRADELQFLQQSGSIPGDTEVKEEGTTEWRPLKRSGILRKPGKEKSQQAGRFSPAASFHESGNRVHTPEQTGSGSSSPPLKAPPLPSPIQEMPVRRSSYGAVMGVIAALIMLAFLAWMFWPENSPAPGMADSGSGAGAASEGDQQSTDDGATPGQSDSGDATENAMASADPDSATNQTSAETNADASSSNDTATMADSAADGAADSDGATVDGAEPQPTDQTAGIDNTAADSTESGLAVGDDDGSRFSISAPGETTFFGIRGSGRRFAYVVDCSGSMQGEPLSRATEELLKSISKLPAHLEYRIVFFDDLAYEFPGGSQGQFIKATARSKEDCKRFIQSINGGGGTDVKLGMGRVLTPSTKPDTVFLLTDGAFEFDTPQYIQSQNRNKRVRVNTIAFVNNSGEPLLKRIADENRGDYRFVR